MSSPAPLKATMRVLALAVAGGVAVAGLEVNLLHSSSSSILRAEKQNDAPKILPVENDVNDTNHDNVKDDEFYDIQLQMNRDRLPGLISGSSAVLP